MRRRLLALLFGLMAVLCLVSAPLAVADDGITGDVTEFACEASGAGWLLDAVDDLDFDIDYCEAVGKVAQKKVDEAWDAVWDSIFGDVIRSAEDAVTWLLRKMFTVALIGPSLDLEATGLFGEDSQVSLAGMLVWLGWVLATFGLMWQLGKMALTGQLKYAGQAMVGWVQNALLTGIGLTIVASLLALGDAFTNGLVDAVFGTGGPAYDRFITVLMPPSVANPMLVLGIVIALLLVGFIQMVLVFLRQSAIPIQCLLLPIAGAGRMGGEATRQWAPRLITSILVVIAYKPILAIIICTGFAEFGHSSTLAEWLRGLATLVLGVLAPGPLTRLFAPIGAEVGAGMGAGGALGAAASVGSYFERRSSETTETTESREDSSEITDAVKHAQYVEKTMGGYSKNGDGGHGGSDDSAGGREAVAHATRTWAGAKVPAQGRTTDPGVDVGVSVGGSAKSGTGAVGAGTASAGASTAAGAAGLAIEVLDGVNDTMQKGSDELGNGGKL
ncbi:hypothetical protein JJV70_15705 [Streptomyces sp. JJ66]|uniref:hypothetical protein n=1 Tax=Streptomyces sp. JJ66 TaxID=2803843 RepID=UPI001C574BF2|nr:hypothetical protein [Streptomyces sp. JJ66]MBW1603523.1 hypothetical protein [Streptomyces sp. JJ66]